MSKALSRSIFCLVMLWIFHSTALAESRFVAVEVANVRSQPNGQKIGQLKRGSEVFVMEITSGWVKIGGAEAGDRWIAESLLCAYAGCFAATPSRASARNVSPPAKTTHRSIGGGYADQCPCSGARNCFGRRGGRFCITSGGNKRYR